MMAFPTSDMAGHARLHDRVMTALNRCLESQDVDFKESAPWPDLRYRIAKTAMAMGNLRDGGIVVVGASERNAIWELTGISEGHLATYQADDVIEQVNAFASPYLELDVVLVRDPSGKTFLAIEAHEFAETPIVCKKSHTAKDTGIVLEAGALYIRPPGVAQTVKVGDARQMHDLLELAAEKRARRMLEAARRIGLVPGAGTTTPLEPRDRELFDQELSGL